jgi:hypothetical protein
MALAVCLLLDDRSDAAVRRLWQRMEADGVPSLLTHTHGRHIPHLSYATMLHGEPGAVFEALADLPQGPTLPLHFDGLGLFRRSRCWLAPAAAPDLVQRQAAVRSALLATGAEVHRCYLAGVWIPHLTLAPRLHLDDLSRVANAVYDILPLSATATSTALIDTSTGEHHPLPHLV